MKKFLLLPVLMCLPALLRAQAPAAQQPGGSLAAAPAREEYNDLARMSAETYMNLHLPPLYELLENARAQSPQVNQFASKKEQEEREIKTLRRSWLKNIKLNAQYSYGSTDVNSLMYYDKNLPVVQNVTGTTGVVDRRSGHFAAPRRDFQPPQPHQAAAQAAGKHRVRDEQLV